MAWLESGVEKGAAGLNPARTPTLTLSDLLTLSLPRAGVAGIITPSSGGGTGPNTGPQTRQVTPPG